jgi:hypothetical protein
MLVVGIAAQVHKWIQLSPSSRGSRMIVVEARPVATHSVNHRTECEASGFKQPSFFERMG